MIVNLRATPYFHSECPTQVCVERENTTKNNTKTVQTKPLAPSLFLYVFLNLFFVVCFRFFKVLLTILHRRALFIFCKQS